MNSRSRNLTTRRFSFGIHLAKNAAAAAVVACAAPLIGQANVIVVDAAGGAGAQFTDLPQAVAAALPGDVLQIRAGDYSAVTLNKALHLRGVARSSVRIIALRTNTAALKISSLASGDTASVENVTLISQSPNVVEFCNGSVLIRETDGSFTIRRSRNVELHRVIAAGLMIDNSEVALQSIFVVQPLMLFPLPVVIAQDSTLSIAQGHIGSVTPDSPALSLRNTTVTTAGFPSISGFDFSSPAIVGTGRITGRIAIQGLIDPGVRRDWITPIPRARLDAQSSTGQQIVVEGTPGETQIMVVGLPDSPRGFVGILGELWMSSPHVFGVTSNSTTFTGYFLTIPNAPALIGVQVTCQALVTYQQEPMRFSSPSQFVVL